MAKDKETHANNDVISNKALYRKIKANKYQSFDFNMVYGKNINGKIIEGYYRDQDETKVQDLISKNEEFIKHHIRKLQKTLNKLKLKILNDLNKTYKEGRLSILMFLDEDWVKDNIGKNPIWKKKYDELTRKINILNSKVRQTD